MKGFDYSQISRRPLPWWEPIKIPRIETSEEFNQHVRRELCRQLRIMIQSDKAGRYDE